MRDENSVDIPKRPKVMKRPASGSGGAFQGIGSRATPFTHPWAKKSHECLEACEALQNFPKPAISSRGGGRIEWRENPARKQRRPSTCFGWRSWLSRCPLSTLQLAESTKPLGKIMSCWNLSLKGETVPHQDHLVRSLSKALKKGALKAIVGTGV